MRAGRAATALAAALLSSVPPLCRGRDLEQVVNQAWAAPWPDGAVPSGNGFAVAPGLILTNAHTVAACRALRTEDGHGRQPAAVVGLDARIDAALVRVASTGRTMGLATMPHAGQPVTVLTHRSGVASGPDAVQGRGEASLRNVQASNVVEITAALRPGDSGSPVLGRSGAVVGMVVGALSSDDGRAVIVPAHALRRFLVYHGVAVREGPAGTPPGPSSAVRVTCER